MLTAERNEEEVLSIVKPLNPWKAPGLGGFNDQFYKSCWNIIGKDVLSIVQQFFPKCNTTQMVSDFRPISLCNEICKIISKILVKRLKLVIHKYISDEQAAFIEGKEIVDNVVSASECLKKINRWEEWEDKWGALKIDMTKDLDKLEWKYLMKMFECLGFSALWFSLLYKLPIHCFPLYIT